MIDFTALKEAEDLDKNLLLNVLEMLSNKLEAKTSGLVKFNELVDDLTVVSGYTNRYTFDLEYVPTSAADMIIVTESGTVVPPSAVLSMEKNKVTITSSTLTVNSVLYVTYKS